MNPILTAPKTIKIDNFHARTGHVLPEASSAVFKQLEETEKYANKNGIKINYQKTKLMLFIVLINDVGFPGQENDVGENITSRKFFKAANLLHLKYVDDMTLAESVDMKSKLVPVPVRERPQPAFQPM